MDSNKLLNSIFKSDHQIKQMIESGFLAMQYSMHNKANDIFKFLNKAKPDNKLISIGLYFSDFMCGNEDASYDLMNIVVSLDRKKDVELISILMSLIYLSGDKDLYDKLMKMLNHSYTNIDKLIKKGSC